MRIYQMYIKNERQRRLFEMSERLANKAQERGELAEKMAELSVDMIEDFRRENFFSMTLPKTLGGEGLSLYEFLLIQERLAVGDGATALSVGWHLGIIKELAEEQIWQPEIFEKFAKEVVEKQVIVNRIASERATGSPTRGGIPETRAVRQGDHYYLSGRKTFCTMASVLDYYIVSAYVEDKDAVGSFLVKSHSPGISIEKTWDTLGMRGTGSDDVIFDQVEVDLEMLVELNNQANPRKAKGWLLHIPACYLGIAIAARNEAIQFAKSFKPNSLKTSIAEVPHIQQKIGEMDLKLMQARSFMYQIATEWDNRTPEGRQEISAELAAVKTVATNVANEVVDLAMRIAGGRGLSKENRFEQFYRDVRAGLHNPPMDDMVIQILAKRALSE
ncbi:acyl-CoA/acyl-ACP dehydrogenase [Amphibacillus sp. MSJ-3]|uniref:acyl-CoA dehydrogenase family protein n=1 Tax=Amphibacillus sp. MSJ-3 TaxID=2841505 RepID=UPI001C0F1C51|nr:acyl-CoA dehydrogenase family protein [Amphibacillus sp. MSJ-3]MBU5594026.1 acyl-CoA/acyl-ACP dehydrogenase [Amphibacillus sp. MSJ-3]